MAEKLDEAKLDHIVEPNKMVASPAAMSADTAPAAMPGVEEIARLLAEVMSRDNHALALHTARKIKALFAPILAEKERPGTYFANLLQREWIGPDGIRYEPTRKRSPDDVEF